MDDPEPSENPVMFPELAVVVQKNVVPETSEVRLMCRMESEQIAFDNGVVVS